MSFDFSSTQAKKNSFEQIFQLSLVDIIERKLRINNRVRIEICLQQNSSVYRGPRIEGSNFKPPEFVKKLKMIVKIKIGLQSTIKYLSYDLFQNLPKIFF